ncbi:MAG: hypothetical protein AAGB04_28230 [Pseudomonadota bacterium]
MPKRKNLSARPKPHRKPKEIAQILADYEASEMTQAAFVASRGIALSTFQLWRRKQRDRTSGLVANDTETSSFIEVIAEPVGSSDHDEFELRWPNGVQLRIPSRFQKQSLKSLLEIIHPNSSPCSR